MMLMQSSDGAFSFKFKHNANVKALIRANKILTF